MKRLLLSLWVLIFIISCETGYKGEPNSTKKSKEINVSLDTNNNNKKSKVPHIEYKEPLDFESPDKKFSGGVESDDLDIGAIRVSQDKESIRLVFDIHKWNQTTEYLGEKVDIAGSYEFSYSSQKALITATIKGYRAFSAKLPKFSKDSVIEKIYMDKYLDDSGYKFHIKLRYDAEVKVFSLKNPARIVVDVTIGY
jgi:hypothetical protein